MVTKIGICVCFLENMIQEQKKLAAMKLKKKKHLEEEVNAGKKGKTKIRWDGGDWGQLK